MTDIEQLLEDLPELAPPAATRVAATHESFDRLMCVYCDAEQTHWVCHACFDRLPR